MVKNGETFLVYHVLLNGREIGIIETHFAYASNYWKGRNTRKTKTEKAKTFTLRKEERKSMIWK